MNWFEQLWSNIRPADVFDVAVIAVLLYIGVVWFRHRASRSLLVAVMLILGLFLCARWLDMYLTTMLFQAGFTALLVALVVIFQQDLRRGFDRLAASKWFSQTPASSTPASLDAVAESIAVLAEKRIGALLVFEGREPIEGHIRGGVPVDGIISLPLLFSIFDPGSPGHDGAALIAGERIEMIGVHLPLSNNFKEIGPGGTRHAAGLGLAEHCDALVVIVSEERGTISIAHRGELEPIKSTEVASHLQQYFDAHKTPDRRDLLTRAITKDFGLKIVCVATACLLWLLLAYRVETLQRTFVVPIEYRNLATEWIIEDPRPTRAEVVLSGSERAFDLLAADRLIVSFDLSNAQEETPYLLDTKKGLQDVPAELRVSQIEPEFVQISVEPAPAGN